MASPGHHRTAINTPVRLLIDLRTLSEEPPTQDAQIPLEFVRSVAALRANDTVCVILDWRDNGATTAWRSILAKDIPLEEIRWFFSPSLEEPVSTAEPIRLLAELMREKLVASVQPDAIVVVSGGDAGAAGPPRYTINLVGNGSDKAAASALTRWACTLACDEPAGSAVATELWRVARAATRQPAPRIIASPPRPRMAFVSPMPPQHTGIATYSAHLLPHLTTHYDITVVSPPRLTGHDGVISWMSPLDFNEVAWRFDRVLYQVGNSAFHRFQLEDLLPYCPGVVTLHDVFLPDYRYANVEAVDRPGRLLEDIAAAHGYAAMHAATTCGANPFLQELPMSGQVISDAAGLIVHSEYAADLIVRHYGAEMAAGIRIIPHLSNTLDLPERKVARDRLGLPDDTLVTCTFGGVGPKKLPLVVLNGWLEGVSKRLKSARLCFVGKVDDELDRHILNRAQQAGCGERVLVTGRVDERRFLDWLAATDVAVQLRVNSNGESSGAVAHCLGSGIPLVVNRLGSLAELPESGVHFISAEPKIEDIAKALAQLHLCPAARESLRANALKYAHDTLAPERVAVLYRQAIEAAYEAGPLIGPAAMVRAAAAIRPRLPKRHQAAFVEAVAANWPMRRQPCLMVVMPESKSDVAMQKVLEELLVRPPKGYRTDPMLLTDDGIRIGYHMATELMGLERIDPKCDLRPKRGDLLVVGVNDASAIATRMQQLVKLRALGVTIWLLLAVQRGLETWRSVFYQVDGVLCMSIDACKAVAGVLQEAEAPATVTIGHDDWKEQLGLADRSRVECC
jgi:glycosyltransferase involved in cell wall biosynthesis